MRGLLVVSVLALGNPSVASADVLEASRGQRLRETSHTVDVEVRDGLAYYKVRRVFHNRGKIAEEARLQISLPYGAVATGLRIKGKHRWHKGELMHARKAEELYVKLTGMGPSEPKDPALLYWSWTDELVLRVFPIFPGKTNTVEYTLTAPTSYADGSYYLTYGRRPEAKNLATPLLRMRGGKIAKFEVDGEVSKRTLRLGRVRLHPVLIANQINNPKVLVRSLEVRGEANWKTAAIDVDIRHTWRGDIELSIVSPSGSLHQLRPQNLGDEKNDLKAIYELDYDGDPNGTWSLLVTDHHPLDGGTLRRWSVRSSATDAHVFRARKPAFIPQPTKSRAGLATLGVRFKKSPTKLRLGRVDLLPKKQFTRLEVDVARRLSKLPRPLSVSFVLDASHTMDEDGITAQLALIGAYLHHVPWAEVALVAYGRHGQLLTKGFTPAKRFAQLRQRLLKSGALTPRNGSHLDRGLAMAVPGLSKRKGSRALVIMTDDRLRPSWANSKALAQLGSLSTDVTVHVVEVASRGKFGLSRNDDHRLFPLAKLRQGVAVGAEGVLEAKRSDLLAETLYLVRPNRLDHVLVKGLPSAAGFKLEASGDDVPANVLPEGAGARWMSQVAQAPRAVWLSGQLWSRPVRYNAVADGEPFNQATAGFVFSQDHYGELSATEQFVLAMYARVVSPVTSYLAIEPGVRPSTIGLERSGVGWGSIGSGSFGTIGAGGGGFGMSWQRLTGRIARLCRSHGKGRVEAKLELQSHEIVDVAVQSTSGAQALDRCVIEALWKERIPRATSHARDWAKVLSFDVGG